MRQHGQQDRANGKLILGRMTDIEAKMWMKREIFIQKLLIKYIKNMRNYASEMI